MQRPTLLALIVFAAACAAGAMGLLTFTAGVWLILGALFVWAAIWLSAKRLRLPATTAPVVGAVAILVLAVGVGGLFGERSLRERDSTLEVIREIVADAEDFAVVGRVLDIPTVTKLPHGGARLRFTLRAESIPYGDKEIVLPSGGINIRVDWYGPRSMAYKRHGPFPMPNEGEGWMIPGTLQEIPLRNSDVPLLVLRHDGRGTRCVHKPAHDAPRWRRWLADVRYRAAAALHEPTLTERWPRGAGLLRAMVLGIRAEIDDDTRNAFRTSGTIHVFAISGLHIGLLAIFFDWFLRFFNLSPRARFLPVVIVVFAYAILTGGRPSAMRAAIMTACYLTSSHIGRSHDSMTSLAFAAAVIAAMDPFQTLDLGFIFSFACAFGLIACMPAAKRVAKHLGEGAKAVQEEEKRKTETALPTDQRKKKKLSEEDEYWNHSVEALANKQQEGFWRFLTEDFQISLVAWLVSTPLTGACFGRFSLIALAANFFVVPLASVAVFFGFFAVAASFFSSSLAAIIAFPGAGVAEIMALLSEGFASVPFCSFETQAWPLWFVVTWYTLLAIARARCMRIPVETKQREEEFEFEA